jgi:hypothetical protein
MGHFYTEMTGTGKNRKEALEDAWSEFLYEEGHRHDRRDEDQGKFLKKVPPKKTVETKRGNVLYIEQVEDLDAPQSEWLEVWEFVLHSHA